MVWRAKSGSWALVGCPCSSLTIELPCFQGHVKVVQYLVKEVNQFPSDIECMRYIATIADKVGVGPLWNKMTCIAIQHSLGTTSFDIRQHTEKYPLT